MSLVIPQFLWPLAAILALQHVIVNVNDPGTWKKLKKAGMVTAGVIVIAFMAYLSLDYLGEAMKGLKQVANQQEQVKTAVMTAINALADDRKSIFLQDIFKALVIVGIFFFILSLYVRRKLKKETWVLGAAILLILIDLLPVDNTYLNKTRR